jgi:hypothetical protein
LFKYDGSHIINEKNGKAVDVAGGNDKENQNIQMWKRHEGLNQQWDIVYVKDMPEETKKGDVNPEFGFKVDTPFYIVSKMA